MKRISAFVCHRAEAVQTTVQLMGEIELYQHWLNNYKVHNIEWSIEKAKQVISAWQNKFAAVSPHFFPRNLISTMHLSFSGRWKKFISTCSILSFLYNCEEGNNEHIFKSALKIPAQQIFHNP
jgi:hypothetical protein